jgi:hypothetical protein
MSSGGSGDYQREPHHLGVGSHKKDVFGIVESQRTHQQPFRPDFNLFAVFGHVLEVLYAARGVS